MKALKLISVLLVLGAVLNCSKISEKVEEKVNEKVNEKIDESLKKIDTSFNKSKIDSLMKSFDTLKSKADSLLNDENNRQTRKTK